tara:strand:+ start:196 stop:615 length:420 start_codon:yes stop_codon:yes gene_type:complete
MTPNNYFTTKTRTDGTRFVALTDGAPEWTRETVYNCHDITGELPNDWTFRTISNVFDLISDEPQIDAYEIAETLTEYTCHDLHTWATPTRWALIDEACEELAEPGADMWRRIQIGQWSHICQIAETIIQAIEDNTEQKD